ncbi:MAG: nucleotidyltransferase family protein [Chloroflexota bacterium]
MQTLILAGGLGTRLGSLASDTPKPMLEVAGRPFLELQLRYLASQGIRDVVLCTGHRAERVRDHFGDGATLGLSIAYAIEDRPLGTGGAVRNALPLIADERILICNGDSFVRFDVAELTRVHGQLGTLASMILVSVEDAGRFGIVELAADGRVVAFAEKVARGAGLVNAGVYVVERRLVEELPSGTSSLERDVFPTLTDGRLGGLPVAGPLIDIGTPAALDAARTDQMLAALAVLQPC